MSQEADVCQTTDAALSLRHIDSAMLTESHCTGHILSPGTPVCLEAGQSSLSVQRPTSLPQLVAAAAEPCLAVLVTVSVEAQPQPDEHHQRETSPPEEELQ